MANIYAVITGASSGIGMEFAKQLARQGYDLVLTARRRDRLSKLGHILKNRYGTNIICVEADLSKLEDCDKLYNRIKDLDVDVFINNAGLGDAGDFAHADLEKELQMIHVNVRAVHVLSKKMIQYFRERDKGSLLNVASSAGLFPGGPFMATYYATKAYVTSLTRAIAEELKEEGSNVYIGMLCPGPVDTEFNDVAGVQFALKGITSQRCVKCALKGIAKKKVVIVPTLRMKAAVSAQRLIPAAKTVKITGGQQRKKLG